MRIQRLQDHWTFRQVDTEEWLPATVPGGVHTDLLALKRIPDPFVSDNELRVKWVAESDWEYRCLFLPTDQLLAEAHIELVCAGLDTLATVSLNDHELGHAANMFQTQRWKVKSLLRTGENVLHLRFIGPARAAAEYDRGQHLPNVNPTLQGGQYLRKAPSQFGWDWGPQLPPLGIWRAVELQGYSHARLADVQLRQHHTAEQVSISVVATIEAQASSSLRVALTVTAPEGTVQTSEAASDQPLTIVIEHPQLWWPNGYGDQPLYQVAVQLIEDNQLLDRRIYTIGLRTLELRQHPDRWGRSFTFVVNGVPIFAKGANWIPSDSFPTRITDQQLEHLISSAAAAHFNMLRVWGGGYYEFEAFYDLCDRYGVLIWQDFMFACAIYPLNDPTYLANVREEVNQVVRRLQHRACLALWCGNNEMETGWVSWGWSTPDRATLKAADQQFFYEILPAWIATADPYRPYWPSSPSSHTPHEAPNSNSVGDNHLWEVWHGLKPFSFYREQYPRFASEFGFQSLPALATIATYADEAEWNMTSYVLEHHQRHTNGNGKIIAYLTQHYRLAKDFSALVYLTQVLQAEAMRIAVEHWRRQRERCSGTLY